VPNKYKSSSKIHAALHAISWAHPLAGHADICDSVLPRIIKEGIINETRKPVNKSEPFTPKHLKNLVSTWRGDFKILYNLR
jgi:hypothetical protein